MEKLTDKEKKNIILSLIYRHFEMDLSDSKDEEIAEMILKICEEKKT